MEKQYTIYITGAAGYVGEMLCEQFGKRSDVRAIIALDKEPQSDYSKKLPKLTYLQHNMADDGWQEKVRDYAPDIVIHTAWQIRSLYGRARTQWRWNVEGSEKVFEFAFAEPSVEKLIYFSTASSYSARRENTFTHLFTEDEGFREDNYIYAKEKKVVEAQLRQRYETAHAEGARHPQIHVLRPAAITGPRGRFMRNRFGLQAALQGTLRGNLFYRIVTLLTLFVPAPPGWVRQFIHEDDVTDIVTLLAFGTNKEPYEVFNIVPSGEPVFARDMARAVGKRVLPMPAWLVRFAFFWVWHLTRGKIPTAPGSWRFYSYPLLMDGTKITRQYGYTYTHHLKDAFEYTNGRYAAHVPDAARREKHAA